MNFLGLTCFKAKAIRCYQAKTHFTPLLRNQKSLKNFPNQHLTTHKKINT